MSAIDSEDGAHLNWLYTRLNAESFSHFLSQVADTFVEEEIWVVCDQASWHTSKQVQVPERIRLKFFPAKTPEDNPTEWLWLWIRSQWTVNRLWQTQEQLIELLCRALRSLTPALVRSIVPTFNLNA